MEEEEPKGKKVEEAVAKYTRMQNDFNVMRMRLDTQQLLDDFELHLKGGREVVRQDIESGNYVTHRIKIGEPLANERGIQQIMLWANQIINPHTVQGNFPIDKHGYSQNYEQAIYELRLQFGNHLMLNIYKWEIEEEDWEGIVDRYMKLVEIFLSRCIGDRERGSYAKTMESKETHMLNPKVGIPLLKK